MVGVMGVDVCVVCRRESIVTRHTSHVTRHTSRVTRHTSHVTRHTSRVTRHTSHVTHHTSHITRNTSHVKDKGEMQGQAAPARAAAARAAAVVPPPPFQSPEYRETICQPVQAASHVTCDARATAVGHLGVVLLAHDQLRSHPIGRTNLHARHASHVTRHTSHADAAHTTLCRAA